MPDWADEVLNKNSDHWCGTFMGSEVLNTKFNTIHSPSRRVYNMSARISRVKLTMIHCLTSQLQNIRAVAILLSLFLNYQKDATTKLAYFSKMYHDKKTEPRIARVTASRVARQPFWHWWQCRINTGNYVMTLFSYRICRNRYLVSVTFKHMIQSYVRHNDPAHYHSSNFVRITQLVPKLKRRTHRQHANLINSSYFPSMN